MNGKRIAVTFWGTGEYLNFLPQWHERLEKFFCPDVEKKYFAFTDGELVGAPSNVTEVKIPHYGFPETFHKTFEEMLKLRDLVSSQFEWLVSVDADLYAIDGIPYEDFFNDKKKYFGVHHPCHVMQMAPHHEKPGAYDRNRLSNAYIDDSILDMRVYYQGCLWGGKVPYIFDMMQQIDDWTKDDVARGIDGRFYEESYMNKWFLTHRRDTRTLHPSYAFPQKYQQYAEFPARMVHLSKDNAALENTEWD